MHEQEIHIRDYIKVIRKRKSTILTFFIITVILAVIGTLTTSRIPMYESSTRIIVEKSDPTPLSEAASYAYTTYDPEFLETQAKIITSSSVAMKVVKSLSLATTYKNLFIEPDEKKKPFRPFVFLTDWIKTLTEPSKPSSTPENISYPVLEAPREQSTEDIIASMIADGINLTPVKDTRIIDISFTFKNPVIAQMIATAIVKAYVEVLLDMRMQSSTDAITWMSKKADEERGKLEKTEKNLSEYMRQKDFVTIEDKVAIVPQKIASLNEELTKATTRRKQLETLARKVKDTPIEEADTLPEISNNRNIQDLQREIIRAEQVVDEYSKKFGARHPQMIKAQNSLQILKDGRAAEIEKIVKQISNDYDLARTNEKNLGSFLSQAKNEANNLNEKYIQFKILKRDVDTNRELYNALIGKMKEQAVSEKVKTANVWVIEPAKIQSSPVSTHKVRKIFLGIILGFLGGIGLAFFIDYLDNTVKSPEEAENKLKTPVLGVISLIRGKNEKVEFSVNKDPLSAISENYKAIRTAILLSSADNPPGCLLVCSMAPKEGKTTTAANLASALSQHGKKVVIIDADLRRPRIHKVYELENQSGLSTYLAGNSEPNIKADNLPDGIHVMTSGPIPPDPSELLGSKRLEVLIENLRTAYDFIIIDSPPLMSVSDSLMLSKIADGVIIVTRAANTTYDIAQKGIKQIRDIGSHIIGLVINGADFRKSGYDYYYGYGYYSYRAEED